MAAEIPDRIREITEARRLPESEVFKRGLERGLEALWEDLVLAQYLDGELDCEETIKRAGRAKVERADQDGRSSKRTLIGPQRVTRSRDSARQGLGPESCTDS